MSCRYAVGNDRCQYESYESNRDDQGKTLEIHPPRKVAKQSVSVPVASPSRTVDGQSRDQTSIVTKTQLGVFLLPTNVRISSA